jgi:serine/threonine protein kinase
VVVFHGFYRLTPPTLKALGINALHELGIIHRDIKPENILIDVRENVRIANFGLSYLAADARPLDRQGAYSTNVAGTPYCMAPEILSLPTPYLTPKTPNTPTPHYTPHNQCNPTKHAGT